MKRIPPKSGQRGRKPGVPNKASKNLRESLEALKFHIADEFVALYRSADLSPSEKVKILNTLLEHTYPRIKEVELKQIDPLPETETVLPSKEELLAIVGGS